MIKDGLQEFLLLKSVKSIEGIYCWNGLLKEAERRSKINISFRLTNHFVLNENNKFSFPLTTSVTKGITKGFSLNVKVIVKGKHFKK